MENIITYKNIDPKGIYEIWISALFGLNGEYRVKLIEEYDPHTTQSVDVNLRWSRDRRWLENYISNLSQQTTVKLVLFGNGGCAGDNHYPLSKYKELFGSWKGFDFLNDLNISVQ